MFRIEIQQTLIGKNNQNTWLLCHIQLGDCRAAQWGFLLAQLRDMGQAEIPRFVIFNYSRINCGSRSARSGSGRLSQPCLCYIIAVTNPWGFSGLLKGTGGGLLLCYRVH